MARRHLGLAVICVVAMLTGYPTAQERPALRDRLAAALRAIDAATADVNTAVVIAITDRTDTIGVMAHGHSDVKTRTPAAPDSLFAIGSIGKSFTAMALMQLFDEDRFDPHAPVTRYLPWFRVHSSPGPITSHHLLTHTAGLPFYRPDLASTPFATFALRDFDVPYPPGSHYWYSDLGFQTLGYVLEQIDHVPYHASIEHRILERIGMTSSVATIDDALRTRMVASYAPWPYDDSLVEQPWFEYRSGDGSIVSTAADMAAYVRVLLNRGALPHGRLISERAFSLMTTPALESYGYGLRVRNIDGDTVIGHGGLFAGYNSYIEAHMNDGYGLVLLANGPPEDRDIGRWIQNTLRAAARGEPLPAPPEKASAKAGDVQEWAGTYRSPGGEVVEFVDVNGTLSLRRGASTLALARTGDDTFRARSADLIVFPFVFERQKQTVVAVSRGPEWYASPGYVGRKNFDVPPAYRAYVGRYDNHNPEFFQVIRVFVNRGRLMAARDGAAGQPLAELGSALFKPAEPEFNPERYRFDSIVDGHALRLMLSGMPLYRIEDR